MAKLKETQAKSLPTEVVHDKATEALRQAADQLEQVRDTITCHTEETACIKKLLKERESSEEESSSPEDNPTPGNPTGTTQQDDVEMEDVEDDSNLPQGMATQTDPPTEEVEEYFGAFGGVNLTNRSEDQITMEGDSTTPITPADDKLLEEYDDLLENLTGAALHLEQ